MTIVDSQQRQQALDITQSFIVQAPAGSGKTELLIQRFLALLAQGVTEPEQIIAITFTRKAAAEMRQRLLSALNNALNPQPPEQAHQQATWKLARQVLAKDEHYNWQLLQTPHRFKIQTIDSLCASLSSQMPIMAKFGAQPAISDKPHALYQQAVDEVLNSLGSKTHWDNSLADIFLHLDNRYYYLQRLLITMLAKRDQWLPHIVNHDINQVKAILENSLKNLAEQTIFKLEEYLEHTEKNKLIQLAQFAASNLEQHPWRQFDDLPENTALRLVAWQSIAQLLLTTKFDWRKTVTKKQGFPAPSSSKNKQQKAIFTQQKECINNLLAEFCDNEKLKNLFIDVSNTPSPCYPEQDWQILSALFQLLPIVAAQLFITFKQHNQVDFIELNSSAQRALGDEDNITDLALSIDYRLKHLLIDEFQDTSITQFRLIEKLTYHWQAQDNNSLFLVGDPMQSIYRFREADVSLFIQAKNHGIGNIDLNFLQLSSNFRSAAPIINWVNQTFTEVFPKQENIDIGAIPYSKAQAIKHSSFEKAINFYSHINDTGCQNDSVIQLIKKLKTHHPDDSIAILVRSRSHIEALLPLLRQHQLEHVAVDIEKLVKAPAISDLLALTQALSHLGNRLSWLAVLRAPWCGLSLNDLHKLSLNKTHNILYQDLINPAIANTLSTDGQCALNRLIPVIKQSLQLKGKLSLRDLLEETWLALGGPACYHDPQTIVHAQSYFAIIEQLERAGDIEDWHLLYSEIDKLYANNQASSDNPIQIMTIHKSKGLEFDHVIMPFLEKAARSDDKQLFNWLLRKNAQGKTDLICSPINAYHLQVGDTYQYIQNINKQKTQLETSRLLYVAVTRAKQSLHLMADLQINDDLEIVQVKKDSLLARLSHQFDSSQTDENMEQATETHENYYTKKLTSAWTHPYPVKADSSKSFNNSTFQLTKSINTKQTDMGTITHYILQHIAEQGLTNWQQLATEQKYHKIQQKCKTLIGPHDLDTTVETIYKMIDNTTGDPEGAWILSAHEEHQCEYKLSTLINNKPKQFIIDRTFLCDDIRWIIDYKTTHCNEKNLTDFLTQQQQLYQQQMLGYANLLRSFGQQKIMLGLYFPAIPAFHTWQYSIEQGEPHEH